MTAEAFRAAAQICREIAETDYRPLGLHAHAAGADLCARVLEIRAVALADLPKSSHAEADIAPDLAIQPNEAAQRLLGLCKLVHGSFGGGLTVTFDERDVAVFADAIAAYEAAQ